jgi:hypothetical protein
MEKYIKYKRIAELVDDVTLSQLFDQLITEGWEIIYYNEIVLADMNILKVIIVVGKRQSNVL